MIKAYIDSIPQTVCYYWLAFKSRGLSRTNSYGPLGEAGVAGYGCVALLVVGRDLYHKLPVVLASFGP